MNEEEVSCADIPKDILTEWMSIVDLHSDKSSPCMKSHKSSTSSVSLKSLEDDWLAFPEQVSLSRHSSHGSYGAVFETDTVLNILGIQRENSTSSLGIAESWEVKAACQLPSPVGGSTSPVANQSSNLVLEDELTVSTNNLPPTPTTQITPKRNLRDFIAWCMPTRRNPVTNGIMSSSSAMCTNPTCGPAAPDSPVVPSRFSSLGKLSKATIEELTLHACFDIDEEDDEDEESDEEGIAEEDMGVFDNPYGAGVLHIADQLTQTMV